MRLLFLLAIVLGAGLLGYRLGRRSGSPTSVSEPPRRPPEIVAPVRPTPSPADDRRELVEAAQELGRWLEGAGNATAQASPATWDRIAEAAARIEAAAGRLATRRD